MQEEKVGLNSIGILAAEYSRLGAMERGMRRIYLTMNGTETSPGAEDAKQANYVLDVYQRGKMTESGRKRLRASIREGQRTFCHDVIAPSHVDKAWRESSQVLRLGLLSRRGSVLPVAFALVRKRGRLLHVHLLCAATSEKARERSGHAGKLNPAPGSLLLSQLEALGRRAGVERLELSAVPYVAEYYRKQGFRHLLPGEVEERPEAVTAAATVRKHRFASNDELDVAYKIGEVHIDAVRSGKTAPEAITEALEWTLPDRMYSVEDGGKIVAYDDRQRVDRKLTDLISRRGELADMVEGYMRLREPGWDRGKDEVELISDETFPMTKLLGARMGEGRTSTRRRRRWKGTRTRRKRN